MKCSFPTDTEPLLAILSQLFAAEGKAREVAVIANADAQVNQIEFDNWNGGTCIFDFNIQIPPIIYSQIIQDLADCKHVIHEKLQSITEQFHDGYIKNVNITPILKTESEWRDKAKVWLTGSGVSNQGRVRSDNVASLTEDGLLFRSQSEINFYKALKTLGVPFAPLPVFVKGGNDYKRIEPDFIIISDGIVLLVEVDGDTVHQETPAEAQVRTNMLAHEGVHIERISSGECKNFAIALSSAKKLLAIIAKIKSNR